MSETDFHCTILSPDTSLRRASRFFWRSSPTTLRSGSSQLSVSRSSKTRVRGVAPARRRARSSLSGVSQYSPRLDQRWVGRVGNRVRSGCRATWIRLHSRGVLIAERRHDLQIRVRSQGEPPVSMYAKNSSPRISKGRRRMGAMNDLLFAISFLTHLVRCQRKREAGRERLTLVPRVQIRAA